MCYVILPTIAFVLLLWSSAAPLFGLFSTDWFVGENGLHYGIASGCPSTDSITIPFVIPSAETSSSSSGSSSSGGSTQGSAGGYVMWTQTGDVISKTYFSDAACTTKTGVEQLNAGECYTSATAKTFSVSVDGSTVSACVFGAGDTTCSNAGVQTCYKRALNKCIVNDAGLSTMRRRRQAAAAASESAPAAAADAAATTAAAPADAAATTAAAPAATTPAATAPAAPETTAAASPVETPAATAPAETGAATVPPSPPAETPVPAPAPETPPSGDANSSFVTFCNSVKWSYLSNSVEEAMAILCIIAGGLGVIALILVLMEVVFRICFKPKPIVPRLTTILAFIQFLALGALCVLMIGYHQWTPPAGTHLGVAYWANIIALGASLVAVFLMSLATIAERKRYQGRFKVMAPPPSVPAGQGGAQAGSGKTESTTAILGNDRSNISLAPSDIAAPPDANDDLEKGIPPPPPPPPK